jgi:hypothetical protein
MALIEQHKNHVDFAIIRLDVHRQHFSLSIPVKRPPLWSSGQSSWLQIQSSMFDSQRGEVVGLEQGALSLVSTIEGLLERKSSDSGLENRDYGCWLSVALTTWLPLYPQKLALTSSTSGGRSVDIVRSRTQITEFVVCKVKGKIVPVLN